MGKSQSLTYGQTAHYVKIVDMTKIFHGIVEWATSSYSCKSKLERQKMKWNLVNCILHPFVSQSVPV